MVGLCQQTSWVSLRMPLGTDVPLLGHLCAHSQGVLPHPVGISSLEWECCCCKVPAWELFHICAASSWEGEPFGPVSRAGLSWRGRCVSAVLLGGARQEFPRTSLFTSARLIVRVCVCGQIHGRCFSHRAGGDAGSAPTRGLPPGDREPWPVTGLVTSCVPLAGDG